MQPNCLIVTRQEMSELIFSGVIGPNTTCRWYLSFLLLVKDPTTTYFKTHPTFGLTFTTLSCYCALESTLGFLL